MSEKRENNVTVRMNRYRNRGYFSFPPVKYQVKTLEESKEHTNSNDESYFTVPSPFFPFLFPNG